MSILRMGMLALMVCVPLTTLSNIARADEVPLVTGEQWVRSSEQLKKVYLIGIANAYHLEAAYHASNPPTDDQSMIPRFGKGLKGHTLDSVREGLNQWYAANPDRVKQPVIETIWFEMVVPGLQ
ncbi:hypothetical protein [Pseudomonas sp. AOB-7]|uniref:hypothetical protein n=1 Tax=Pseudomonas sp. AOB-7 TaxID=2482750 RepID=UPI0015ABDE17|nr:hypothetical protein [Pseudomonas sp. AOB-7]